MRTNHRRFWPTTAMVDSSLHKSTYRSGRTPSFDPKAKRFVGDHDHALPARDADALMVVPDKV